MTTITANSTVGIYLSSPFYTNPVVINPGVTISGGSGYGVGGFTGAWTLLNSGVIASTGGNGVYLGAGGYITNAASASINGADGVEITGGSGTIVNAGGIAGNTTSSIGVLLAAGGNVTNQSGGTISGSTGVDLTAGGIVTNAASASITGGYGGVEISGGVGTMVNSGYVAGSGAGGIGVLLGSGGSITNATAASITGVAYGVDLSAGGTLTNAGTIVGNSGTAIVFGGTANLLVLDPGYKLSGVAIGGTSAINALELASATSAGTLSGLGTEFVNFKQTTIDTGASWVLNGANTIEAATTLTELRGATLNVSGTFVNDGTIVLDSSTLTVGGLTGSGPVTIGAGSTLAVKGTISSGETLSLAGSGAYLHLIAPDSVTGNVTNFAPEETIDLKGIDPTSVSYSNGRLSFSGGSFALSLANPGSVTASASGDGAAVSVPCFCANTLIRTAGGEVPVESLRVGDFVVTHWGVPRRIRWIGIRRIDLKRHADPERVMPVRIRAGALADSVPRRDLLVSGDHALLIDEMLVPARLLVNGASVVPETSARHVTYYHLELDSHDILLAEGAPAESFLDTGNTVTFDNAGPTIVLHPNFAASRREACSYAPLAVIPVLVEPVWRRMAARAEALGWQLPRCGSQQIYPARAS